MKTRRIVTKALPVLILSCAVQPLLAQAPIEATARITGNLRRGYASPPQPLAVLNGNLIFLNYTPGSGWELWRTDGSPWSATRIKDIHPGPGSLDGYPSALGGTPINFVEMNGNLFFVADDGVSGMDIWKTDGTEGGTIRVKDLPPGPQWFEPVLLPMDGLFYCLRHGENGAELWKSDGTEAGTILVKVLPNWNVSHLARVEETVYFSVTGGDQAGLWRSDGTEAGTYRVTPRSDHYVDPWSIVGENGRIFFADIGTHDSSRRIWTSDGTLEGRKLLKTSNSGSYSRDHFCWDGVLFFTAEGRLWTSDGTEEGTVPFGHGKALYTTERIEIGGTLFLSIFGTSGHELWKTDGKPNGSVLLHTFPRDNPHNGTGVHSLSAANGTLYFTAYDEAGGYEAWRSDGTPEGTLRIKDIDPGPGSSSPRGPQLVNGVPLLLALDGGNRAHLWRTDGTEAGTTMVKEIYGPTPDWYNSAYWLGSTPTKAFFLAQRPENKVDLWVTDGSADGTLRVAQLSQRPGGESPFVLAILGERAILSVPHLDGGTELWSTDGTPEGLVPLGNTFGPNYSYLGGENLRHATELNGTLFFYVRDEDGFLHLWKSDGTEAGTIPVAELGPYSHLEGDMVHANGALFFSTLDENSRSWLWKTDGTKTGTVRIKSLDAPPGELVAIQSAVFFTLNDERWHNQLWKSDGTEAGTVLVRSFPEGPIHLQPQGSNLLVFAHNPSANQWELWKSDGTGAGTVFVKAIGPGGDLTTEVNGMVFFVAGGHLSKTDGTAEGTLELKKFDDWPHGLVPAGRFAFFHSVEQLWRSDGSENGTILLKQTTNSTVHSLTAVDDIVYFWTYTWEFDGQNGTERHDLWKSDGTEAGTVLVRENLPSPFGGEFEPVRTVAHGVLYFLTYPNLEFGEVWRSDGTAEGTYRLPTPGNSPLSFPRGGFGRVPRMVAAGDTVFFTADDGIHGSALWKVLRDSDGDGLWDDWEKEHFDGAAVANDDPDADGMNNWQESRAGTDPKDSASFLQFTRVTPLANSKVRLEWRSVPNREYVLLRTSALPVNLDDLTVVERHIPATPPVNSFVDTSATGPGPHFYLLGVEGSPGP